MWNDRPIEKKLEEQLKADTSLDGASLYARYVTARGKLISDILPWIKTYEPLLTDHGPEHIANVLDNADALLGCSHSSSGIVLLKPMELYILCMGILFHDVGNLFGRTGHNQKIVEVYGAIFKGLFDEKDEKAAVIRAARAHTGLSSSGSPDTLKELGVTPCYVYGKPINLTVIGALVRFADELAEGPQRTSKYLLDSCLISEVDPSRIFHEYAKITDIAIDRGGERVALTYRIDFKNCKNEDEVVKEVSRIEKLLRLVYKRIVKLDQERRYARHYCELLSPFKTTMVVIEFWLDNEWKIDTELRPILLSDLVVPGEPVKQIDEHDGSYVLESVLQLLRPHLQTVQQEEGAE